MKETDLHLCEKDAKQVTPPLSAGCVSVERSCYRVGVEKVITDIDINESPHRGLVSLLALTCALRQA